MAERITISRTRGMGDIPLGFLHDVLESISHISVPPLEPSERIEVSYSSRDGRCSVSVEHINASLASE